MIMRSSQGDSHPSASDLTRTRTAAPVPACSMPLDSALGEFEATLSPSLQPSPAAGSRTYRERLCRTCKVPAHRGRCREIACFRHNLKAGWQQWQPDPRRAACCVCVSQSAAVLIATCDFLGMGGRSSLCRMSAISRLRELTRRRSSAIAAPSFALSLSPVKNGSDIGLPFIAALRRQGQRAGSRIAPIESNRRSATSGARTYWGPPPRRALQRSGRRKKPWARRLGRRSTGSLLPALDLDVDFDWVDDRVRGLGSFAFRRIEQRFHFFKVCILPDD